MSHYRLVSLEMEGFRSFGDRQKIVFPERGLILISGKYKGSSVSSGAGKSAILLAITFALDICDLPATELKCWYSKSMYVKLTITDGTNIFEIERTPKMNLIINGTPHSELVKGAKEELYSRLGVPAEILEQVSSRAQRSRGVFYNTSDKELKEFLTQTLKLGYMESEADRFNKKANALEAAIAIHKRDIQNYEALLLNSVVTQKEVEDAQAMVLQATNTLNSLQTGDTSEITAENAKLDLELMQISQEWGSINGEIQKINLVNSNINTKRNENLQIRANVTKMNEELKVLRENMCHTCVRPWHDDKQQSLILQKDNEINRQLEMMKANIEYINNSQPMLDSITIHQNRQQELQVKQQGINARKQELARKMGETQAPVSIAMQAKTSAELSLNTILSKQKTYETINANILKAKTSLLADEAEYEINYYAGKTIGRNGFLAFVFEETLVSIQNKSNDMIKRLPNTEKFSLEISTTKQVKSTKSIKEEIKKAILVNGFEVSFKSLSGGQQAAVELSTDFATSREIKQKSGAGIGWILFDESMEGLGPSEKQTAIEFIKENFDGQIIMIDHATEIKESFTQVIEVEYDGKFSHITSN